MKNVVAIGGGHGLSAILSGIRDIKDINISAIVTVADDGGSTGRLRKRYTIPAMGDVRNVILALSDSEPLMHELMNYRFEGEDNMDIAGHSLGNLILTALTNMTGSFDEAIRITSDMVKVKGDIIPSTLQNVTLFARMDDDTIVKGEANIPSLIHNIEKVFYQVDVKANEKAIEAIRNADLILYGIGSLYTSILPNTIIPGINEALHACKASKVYIANCMTQSNETYNYDLKAHLDAFEKHMTPVDMVLMHSDRIPEMNRMRYQRQNSIEVEDHGDCHIPVIKKPLLKFTGGLVRHDPALVREAVKELL
ncbi:MAG: uridine diphosphate-N-acetylglucosamine-binding protein YvcK [Erysipelotrichaceae bacterium]|nr:uridine diphosphate-N-acetylglucosamine-binding protein YvcK [Erysipelotrichaceae bacterium]MBR6233385.1 uridine diphosphate-N-acetylglucosamine-binding protein YvcK [Erysipelotrichaceae bacterium]